MSCSDDARQCTQLTSEGHCFDKSVAHPTWGEEENTWVKCPFVYD